MCVWRAEPSGSCPAMASLSLERNCIADNRNSGHPRKDCSISSCGFLSAWPSNMNSDSSFGRKNVAPSVSILFCNRSVPCVALYHPLGLV